jgi:nitric oxide reductase large subunit
LLATGESKAEVIAKAVEGPITSMISATALQLHARCTVVVDEAAASKLQAADYYRWIFANEPEWEEFRLYRTWLTRQAEYRNEIERTQPEKGSLAGLIHVSA